VTLGLLLALGAAHVRAQALQDSSRAESSTRAAPTAPITRVVAPDSARAALPAGGRTVTDSVRAPAPDRLRLALPVPGRAPSGGPRVITGRPAGRGTGPLRPPSRFEAPRWVMLRSLVVPGWGQLCNGSWIKALAVAGGEGALGYDILQDWRELDRLNAQVDAARSNNDAQAELTAINAYNDRQTTLVAREWLLAGVVVYALMDAYVDAHFRRFDVEFKHDPALPEGVPARSESRLSIRWSF